MEWLARFSGQAEFVNSEIVPWVLRLVMAGLVILAACPSGVTANAYTFAARADVPLCVTLSALTSVITVFTIPFLIGLALEVFAEPGQTVAMSPRNMLLNLMTLTLIPLALGMLFRRFFPAQAERAVEPIRRIVLWLMIAVLLLGVVASSEEIRDNFLAAGFVVVVMNVATMALGFGAARLFRLPLEQVVTITFEVGVQNLALGLTIAYVILGVPEFAISALIYAAVMPATALAFLAVARRMLAAER